MICNQAIKFLQNDVLQDYKDLINLLFIKLYKLTGYRNTSQNITKHHRSLIVKKIVLNKYYNHFK